MDSKMSHLAWLHKVTVMKTLILLLSLGFFSYIYLHGNNSLDLTSVVSSKKFGVKLQEPGYDKCQPIPIK